MLLVRIMIVLFLKLQKLEMQPTLILIKFKIIVFVYLFIKENGIRYLRREWMSSQENVRGRMEKIWYIKSTTVLGELERGCFGYNSFKVIENVESYLERAPLNYWISTSNRFFMHINNNRGVNWVNRKSPQIEPQLQYELIDEKGRTRKIV